MRNRYPGPSVSALEPLLDVRFSFLSIVNQELKATRSQAGTAARSKADGSRERCSNKEITL